MDRFQSTVEIDAPASVCYEKWHHFDQFPHYMNNVKAVEPLGGNRWHWVVAGPLGANVEWDADIDRDEPNRLISWHTLENSNIKAQGTVRFEEAGSDRTTMFCDLQYQAPAGNLGEALVNLLQNPHKMVDEELQNFKHLVEGTNVPAEKAHVGKTLEPESFVVPVTIAAASAGFSENNDTGYDGPYGLDNDLSDAVILGDEEDNLEEAIALRNLQAEETPYLASEGALHSEDLRDMQDFGSGQDESDVFTESLDIEEEDLESYTEGIDEEIDIGRGPREERAEPREEIRRD